MSKTYVKDGMALKRSFALLIKADGHSFSRLHICCGHAYVLLYMMFA